MSFETLSHTIEALLVRQNLRGMAPMRESLTAGYIERSADIIKANKGVVLIGTGFPVAGTFETDGPVGAIALYTAFEALGYEPVMVCGAPLSNYLSERYRVEVIRVGPNAERFDEARQALDKWQPSLLVSIERPGQAADGGYYNMRREDISAYTACFDSFFELATCPTLAIGDGGNEIGMGNLAQPLQALDIEPAMTRCDELIVADVSNWGALGLIAMLEAKTGVALLEKIDSLGSLKFLSDCGSVDGVTRRNELTEDGLPATEGLTLLVDLQRVVNEFNQTKGQ